MPIDTVCTGCSRVLRVADEHAGKLARCPQCGQTYRVPEIAAAGRPAAETNPFSEQYAAPVPISDNPYQTPGQPAAPARSAQPHRGTTVLILGVLGLLFCNILSPVAWLMGRSDLQQMTAGVMDPAGRGMTQAGMILGIIGSLVCLGVFGLGFLLTVLTALGH